jgi:metal transporter CNNM
MLSSDVTLSYDTLIAIFKAGHSRIPIYAGSDINDIIGLLLTKDLIFIDPDDEVPISSFIEIFGRGTSRN